MSDFEEYREILQLMRGIKSNVISLAKTYTDAENRSVLEYMEYVEKMNKGLFTKKALIKMREMQTEPVMEFITHAYTSLTVVVSHLDDILSRHRRTLELLGNTDAYKDSIDASALNELSMPELLILILPHIQ